VASRFVFRARGGDGFFAWLGFEDGALRGGGERHVANVVGTRAGSFALESRSLRRAKVRVLLLPGVGAGVDARAGGVARHHCQRNASNYTGHRADTHLVHRSVLPAARIAAAGGRLEIFCARSGCGAHTEIFRGGRLKYQSQESESHELESGELEEVTYAAARS